MRHFVWAAILVGCNSDSALQGKSPEDPPQDLDPTVVPDTTDPTTTDPTTTDPTTTDPTTTDPTTTDPTTTDPTSPTVPLPVCSGGSSWRDTLPALPSTAPVPPTLTVNTGDALADCQGDPIFTSDPLTTGLFTSGTAHDEGAWYFEAKTSIYQAGWSTASIFAAPSASQHGSAIWGGTWASAAYYTTGIGTVGVAVDLDAGHAWFYENGILVVDEVLSLDPGVGAFRAALTSMTGNQIIVNTGSDPFDYQPPAGFLAWSSDPAGGGGPCPVDADVPAPPAPITATGTGGYALSTFLSDAAEPTELVVLGVYEPQAANNVIDVTVNRTTPVTLILDAYESVEWNIIPGAGSNIVQVVVLGYNSQAVAGAPVGVPVTILTASAGFDVPLGHQWPYSTDGDDTQGLVDRAEEAVCLPLKMFGGAYRADSFTVN